MERESNVFSAEEQKQSHIFEWLISAEVPKHPGFTFQQKLDRLEATQMVGKKKVIQKQN